MRYPSNRDAMSVTSVTTRTMRRDMGQGSCCAARVYSGTALAVRSNGQRNTEKLKCLYHAVMRAFQRIPTSMPVEIKMSSLINALNKGVKLVSKHY
ncbi:hypothetical protein NDU88_002561 [Pleurodeles waltl]|uniref:Uncharacterized protein n=1 Tax=Pleurodeles waltl TaxID=8319 RepID=A0AAV7QC38_PLEWA|nr:hypothetical protein NDU88_002561 [Pleurodeles waltl]